jgi:tol-pal system protein YbgF
MRSRALLPVTVLAALAACSTTRPEEEPAYIKATAVEARVDRVERQNAALQTLQSDVAALQQELRRLRGELEESAHGARSAATESRNLYADLERRLKALEDRPVTVVPPTAPGGAEASPTAAAPVPVAPSVADRDAYQAALDHLKNRDFAAAEKALKSFLVSFPQSALADNAIYWLGETSYSQGRFQEAVAAFTRVVKEHPESRKVPDALLMIGKAQYELRHFKESRDALTQLLKNHKDSTAAAEARTRLKRLDAERH